MTRLEQPSKCASRMDRIPFLSYVLKFWTPNWININIKVPSHTIFVSILLDISTDKNLVLPVAKKLNPEVIC